MCGTGILQTKLFGVIIRGSRCLAGRLSWEVLFYDDLVGVVTSHVTKMAVTPLNPPWPKPPVVRKLHGSVFYVFEVIADYSFSLREKGISAIYCEKIVENIKSLIRTAKLITMIPKQFFRPLSTVLACM